MAPYRPADLDGRNATLDSPVSPDGVPVPGRRYEIPARQGRAVRLKGGQRLAITNPSGH